MAITSIGYPAANPASPQPGDFIRADQWAVMESLVGVKHAVVGSGDFAVTQTNAVDRGISVAAGSVFAGGVLTTSDSAVTVAATTVSSGVRYDTVVARFVWGTTKATSLVIVPGGSSSGIASGLVMNPGVQYDVPLALIKVTAGSTVIQVVGDLRNFKTYSYVVDDVQAFSATPRDHHATVRLPDGSVNEFRTGVGWIGVSKPGHVWDATYGFLPLVISESSTAAVNGSTAAGGAADGSVTVPLSKTYAGAERYVWLADNGDFQAQNAMWTRGVARPANGNISSLTVSYAQARGGTARFTILGVLSSPNFT